MKAFGLTGNIGCGKSTVASMLAKHSDIKIIDCDKLAKEIMASGIYKEEINRIVGAEVFPGGFIDFKVIAKNIFSDTNKRQLFEKLIHPLVWSAAEIIAAKANRKIVVVESAIIFETKSSEMFQAMITVTCNKKEQFRRLQQNRFMSNTEIKARIASQIPSKEKEKQSDFVIDTNCSLLNLENRVNVLYQKLKERKEQ